MTIAIAMTSTNCQSCIHAHTSAAAIRIFPMVRQDTSKERTLMW